jgi:DNA (cytosine-5)-methyltransferase 1
MKVMDLFAGIGGFSVAAHAMGWETVVMVEWDKKRRLWLQKIYPQTFIHGDIDTFDNSPYRNSIDLICGGEPCQGNSIAGNRKGVSDPRFKWPAYLRQVDEVAPLWVVNENVTGSISNGILDRKISDLEAIGYACWPPLVIPARAAGCHHERERVYLVAYSLRTGRRQLNTSALPAEQTKGNVWNGAQRPAPLGPVTRYANSSEILRAADGLSSGIPASDRNKAIESYGNAVVPQIPYKIFQAIQHTENTTTP